MFESDIFNNYQHELKESHKKRKSGTGTGMSGMMGGSGMGALRGGGMGGMR